MRTTFTTTLLDLVQSINAYAANDREVVATVAYLVNSGRVRLGGTFAGATIRLPPARHARARPVECIGVSPAPRATASIYHRNTNPQ